MESSPLGLVVVSPKAGCHELKTPVEMSSVDLGREAFYTEVYRIYYTHCK